MRFRALSRLLLIGLILSPGLGWAQPKLEVSPEAFDLGRRPQNEGGYDFLFTLKNTGTELLVIDKVRPFCGCTTVDLVKKELTPGEAVELHGKLNTRGFEGPVQKSIMIESNDAKTPKKILSINAVPEASRLMLTGVIIVLAVLAQRRRR